LRRRVRRHRRHRDASFGAENLLFTFGAAAMGFFVTASLACRAGCSACSIARASEEASSTSSPTAIDIIVRGVKSGLPLNQCLRTIASESPEPLRAEFRMIVDGQAMGVPLDDNLERMYERMPLSEVNFFSIVLGIQQKTGGNLSEALGNLSSVLRVAEAAEGKGQSACVGSQVASAMIIGSLPFIVMGPRLHGAPRLHVDPVHDIAWAISSCSSPATMMSMGIFIMRSMINFKF
jgi:tight adherence protein B